MATRASLAGAACVLALLALASAVRACTRRAAGLSFAGRALPCGVHRASGRGRRVDAHDGTRASTRARRCPLARSALTTRRAAQERVQVVSQSATSTVGSAPVSATATAGTSATPASATATSGSAFAPSASAQQPKVVYDDGSSSKLQGAFATAESTTVGGPAATPEQHQQQQQQEQQTNSTPVVLVDHKSVPWPSTNELNTDPFGMNLLPTMIRAERNSAQVRVDAAACPRQ